MLDLQIHIPLHYVLVSITIVLHTYLVKGLDIELQ
jgi:hypothetical protein